LRQDNITGEFFDSERGPMKHKLHSRKIVYDVVPEFTGQGLADNLAINTIYHVLGQ
jgi:hypothetical protein